MTQRLFTLKSTLTAALLLAFLAACQTTPPPTVVDDHTLSVTVAGDGAGTVSIEPAGTSVSTGTSTFDFAADTEVTLTATADAGSTFTGWTGACSGAGLGPCVLTMDADKSATATFVLGEPEMRTLTVSVTGDGVGEGSVTSAPAGIDAAVDETDSAEFVENTDVTLTATAGANSRFAGWGGACAGTETTCVVTMDADASVTAEFVEILIGDEITAEFVIAAGSDDAEEFEVDLASANWPAGSVHVTSSDLDLTYDTQFSSTVKVGLRYADVTIPQGAIIVSASITFTRHAAGAGEVTLTIEGQALDDAPTFVHDGTGTPSHGISSRPRTSASVDWNSTTAWGATEATPDLAAIVQEIVDRAAWESGNALAFTITSLDSDASNYRRADSFESGNPPVLTITYAVPEPI